MGNQTDTSLVSATPIPADAPTAQNGASLDPPASPVVADGTVAVAVGAVDKVTPPRIDKDLTSPDLFLNRELTWLAFNRRVLHEAEDQRNPLLERLKFLAITASNLDEFFMKRIGGLKQQVVAGMQELTVDGRTPQQQVAESYLEVREQEQRQRELVPQILGELENYGIRVRDYSSLTPDERKQIREYYYKNIFPLVTPQAMDPAHPFPFVSNLSLNLLVTARYQDDSDPMMARVKVPIGFGIPRFLRIGNQMISFASKTSSPTISICCSPRC
jgi:polyphosphate kinase